MRYRSLTGFVSSLTRPNAVLHLSYKFMKGFDRELVKANLPLPALADFRRTGRLPKDLVPLKVQSLDLRYYDKMGETITEVPHWIGLLDPDTLVQITWPRSAQLSEYEDVVVKGGTRVVVSYAKALMEGGKVFVPEAKLVILGKVGGRVRLHWLS